MLGMSFLKVEQLIFQKVRLPPRIIKVTVIFPKTTMYTCYQELPVIYLESTAAYQKLPKIMGVYLINRETHVCT